MLSKEGIAIQQYTVTGMSCAACSARVEKAVSSMPGVSSCAVSLLTNSMAVDGTADSAEIIAAVEKAGYGAALKGAKSKAEPEQALEDRETPKMRKRLVTSLVFLLPLMYVSMGGLMWGWPLPAFMETNPFLSALTEFILSAVILVINGKFFINGFKGAVRLAPNMDTLVAMGSSASFIYSTVLLYLAADAYTAGAAGYGRSLIADMYFDSSAMILTLITVGKLLEAKSKGRTTDALRSLMKIRPDTARIEKNGTEIEVPVESLNTGDVFILKPGDSIPVDGTVIEGESSVDESALTGESIPVDKTPGSQVSAGTINSSGYLRCEALRVGEDTAIARIISLVGDAAASKAPIARIADKVSGVFVPAVISIAFVTTAVWLLLGQTIGFSLARGISVLVISCPCALGLATPVAIMVGNGVGARNGILFKNAEALEITGKTDTAVFDKTGTLTVGKPEVTDIYAAAGITQEKLLKAAASVESRSEHPIAGAIAEKARSMDVETVPVERFRAFSGHGVSALINGTETAGGNREFIEKYCRVSEADAQTAEGFAQEGKTPVYISVNGVLSGIIAVADTVKPDSRDTIERLKKMGIRSVMLTGDNEVTAAAIGKQLGIDTVYAGVLPDGKEKIVRRLSRTGRTLMIGDGINDAPALTRADIGMAVGSGTDVAIDSADVVLMKGSLAEAAAAVSLSRTTLRIIKENLFWAFFYNTIGIPVAAGVFIGLGIKLNPMIGAAAMSLSSFCVVSNALRINFAKIYDRSKDRPLKNKKKKEIGTMEKTMKIEGMMCPHCEARVKKALEALDGVDSAIVSFASGTAVVTYSGLTDEQLRETVEAQGYEVKGIN